MHDETRGRAAIRIHPLVERRVFLVKTTVMNGLFSKQMAAVVDAAVQNYSMNCNNYCQPSKNIRLSRAIGGRGDRC